MPQGREQKNINCKQQFGKKMLMKEKRCDMI